MPDRNPVSPSDNAHLFEFGDVWYENDDSFGPINSDHLMDLDQEWDEIAYQIESETELLVQEYEQQQSTAPPPLEANNGEVSILTDPEQSMLMSAYGGHRGALDDVAFLEGVGGEGREYLDHEGVIDLSNGIQFSPNQVKDFLQDRSREVIGTSEKDDQNCPICRSEYGKEREDTTEPGLGSDQDLPAEDAPEEYAVKLPCGHLFWEFAASR